MKATATTPEKNKAIVVVECENAKDLRIIAAIANMPQLGNAINNVFGDWRCPFYAALLKAGHTFDSDETITLRDAMRRM